MDQIKQRNNKNLVQFSQIHFSKKSIQILISISVFSFLLSFSPLLHFLSSFSMQLFSYTSDRNYIFLFCNGILVFLIRNSLLTDTCSPSTDTNYAYTMQNKNEEDQGGEYKNLVRIADGENKILTTQQDGSDEEEVEEDGSVVIDNEEEEMGLMSAEELNKKCEEFVVIDHEEKEMGLMSAEELNKKCEEFVVIDHEEEAMGLMSAEELNKKCEEEEMGLMSAEELNKKWEEFVVIDHEEEEIILMSAEEFNKKCEEFIKKVKEKIKFEAQQQLIIV